MEKKSIQGYFFFGTAVRYLQDISTGTNIFGEGYILENINRCLDELDKLGLKVTKIASWKLIKFRDELTRISDKNSLLSKEQSEELEEICHELRSTLEAELQTHEAFIVTPKRFDIDKLLDDIGSLMSPGVFSSLPEISRFDLVEAGKCIAFERPTAAAFHLLRATEAVLRYFYCTLIRTKRVPNLLWGDIVLDLRSRQKTKHHTTLYNNLDNLRHSYRNPTQHPEAIYDIHEVQDLLPLCFEVINRMIKIIQAL
ncbi:hypothetical protein ES703_10666 [subsurface metagenome]